MNIRADFRKEFTVNISLFVTLGISHATFVDLPQEHLRKAFIQFAEGFVQSEGSRGARGRHPFFFLHGHGGHGHPAALGLPAVGVGVHIAVIDVCGNVSKELSTDGIGGSVKDDQIHRHVVGQQEIPDGIHRHL